MADSDAPKDQAPVNQLVTSEQREYLGKLFRHIVLTAPVDYTNKEIQDIKTAVYTMLERIRTKVNNRRIFNIARVIPAGSMAEETSLWKIFDGTKHYLEFDFLAQLKDSIKQCKDQRRQKHFQRSIECRGCIRIVKPPVELKRLRQYCNREGKFNAENLEDRDPISALFVKEINYCLTSSCDCLSFRCVYDGVGDYIKISLLPSSVERMHGCGECTVAMPTGTLHVSTEKSVIQGLLNPNNSYLTFQWNSKVRSLLAPDRLLIHEPLPISSLRIYVDFLPALESQKPTSSGAGEEHDYFIVPKRCNVCVVDYDYNNGGYDNRWRKSWCMAELNTFTTEMSDKHRRCFRIMKYLSEARWLASLPSYHIKTVVLRHHTLCSDTTDDCVDCVLGIFKELLQAYETNELLSYQSNLNILQGTHVVIDLRKKRCEQYINNLC